MEQAGNVNHEGNQSQNHEWDKSTDYQTDPTQMAQSNQQQNLQDQSSFNQDSVMQEENDKSDNYPIFNQERIHSKNQYTFEEEDNSILSIRYSDDQQLIAFGLMNSQIKFINSSTFKDVFQLKDKQTDAPCTSVRWCPAGNIANCLLAAYTNGTIVYWHTSGKKILHRYEDPENPINAMDISPEGLKFAAAGNDGQIRLYDIGKKTKPSILLGTPNAPVHQNRVYGIKYDPKNPNLLYTGGWDNNIMIWDVRQGQSVTYIGGPRIHSDSIDIQDNQLLAGSWRTERQLEIFDLRTYGRLQQIKWENFSYKQSKSSQVYCCQYSKNQPNLILAGCSGTNEIRMFDADKNYELAGYFKENINSSVFALDSSKIEPVITYGDSNGQYGALRIE